MIITKRDLKLFEKLSSYGMLTTKQIAQIFFPHVSLTTVLRRLRILEGGHLLKRVLGLECNGILWVLTEKSADAADVVLAKRNWNKNLLEHDFKLSCLRLTLEEYGFAHSWIPEHQIRSLALTKYGFEGAKSKLIPDGIMGVDRGSMETVAVELELTLKDQLRIKDIVRRYQARKDLQAVWYVAKNKTILKSIFREWSQAKDKDTQIILYGSLYDEVVKTPLEARLWGEKNTYRLKDLWSVSPAHRTAHRVSRDFLSPNHSKANLTTEDQRINWNFDSTKNAVSTTDLPLTTLLRV